MINKSYLNLVKSVFSHTLFWVFSIVIMAFIFRLSNSVDKLDYINALLCHIAIITSVYFNFLSINIWLKRNQFVVYALSVLIIIAIAILINHYTFKTLVDFILPDYYLVAQFNHIEFGIITAIYLSITSSLKLSKSWFDLQRINHHITASQKEKIDSELQNLKAQINPHFLFNSLNIIYALALKKDELTPEVILKLSDILRYVIYDSTQDSVLLSSEIALLKKYIELQKYRIDDSDVITFDYEIEQDRPMTPLIFLTLVENSFKHGAKGDTENVFINIKLYAYDQKVTFFIENNKANNSSSKHKGIGLENIKQRLALAYPNRHQFFIHETTNTFKVELEITYEH